MLFIYCTTTRVVTDLGKERHKLDKLYSMENLQKFVVHKIYFEAIYKCSRVK